MISTKSLIGWLLCCGVFAASASFAGGQTDVSFKYVGSGYDVSEPDEYNMAINILLNEAKGTFGTSSSSILSEFQPDFDQSVSCPAGYPLAYDLVRCVTTLTTANLDILYGMFTDGWLCMTADMYEWVGEASGVWFDGTGRFEGASGTWTTEYLGHNLDADSGYRTITGTMNGVLEMH